VLTAFSGTAYLGGASYLAGYAVAMTLLGCASVLIATHQSRARRSFLAVLIPIAVAEPIAIAAFHRDVIQVVQVLNLTVLTLVVGLAALLLRGSHSAAKSPAGLATRSLPAELNA